MPGLNIRLGRLWVGFCLVVACGLLFFSVAASGGPSLMGSDIPLMDGAKIINEKQVMGAGSGRVELETTASPEEVAHFYNTAMQQKGWPAGSVLSAGGQSRLMLNHQGDQFVLMAGSRNGKTRVILAWVRKTPKRSPKAVNTMVQKATVEPKIKKISRVIPKNDTGQQVSLPPDLPVADHRLEMFAPTIHTDNTLPLDQPVVISFSQPVDPAFVDFDIAPDKAGWTAQWSSDFDQVKLVPAVSPEPGSKIQLTATVLGGPEIRKTITYRRLPPLQQLGYDLQKGRIDINQASRYRIFSLFEPSGVPEAYRPVRALPSETPLLNTVRKDLSRLDEKTRAELLPYFLSPLNPRSYYHSKLQEASAQSLPGRRFSLVPNAWAENVTLTCLEVYRAKNGPKMDIFGTPDLNAPARLAHDLLESKSIYERFKKLLGVDVPTPTNTIVIFLISDVVKVYGKGFDKCYGFYFEDAETGEPIIVLSSKTFDQERHMGSTLAHEMFHAFQGAFTPLEKADTWIKECTAVWAEDYIEKTWNTEQEYLRSAFEPRRQLMQQLNSNAELVPYGMYLFPYYLTKVSPKDPAVIRRIWENCASGSCAGDGAIAAVNSALGGKLDATWKKFSLATLDVAPEDKRLPDTVGKFGGVAPLKIKSSHGFKKIVLSKNGSGGSVAVIQGINACYFHVTNDNTGPTAPAVRFDLGSFKNDSDRIYVQSVITFLDGHKVYEDWTGKEERLFCLNIESQCFTEIHTVISCSDSQKKKYKSFRISPAPTSRCFAATVVLSRKLEEREIYESTRTIDIATTETQSRSRSGKRWATLVLDLALDEKIHDQQHLALDIMEGRAKDVDPHEVKEMRNTLENMMKTTQAHLDPETGLMKIRYRIKKCRINSARGVYRSRSEGERRKAQGVSKQWEANFTKQWSPMGLDADTRKRLERDHARVEVYFEPETGKIVWVKLPPLDIDMHVTEQSHGQTIRQTAHGYETIPHSNSESKEEEFQLTFSSESKAKKKLPMDPVWLAKEATNLSASGAGRIEKPVNKQTSDANKKSSTTGFTSETFEWSINLAAKQ